MTESNNSRINQLNNCINEIISLLEKDLERLKTTKSKHSIKSKKNIADTLNKLVNLIIQVHKLNQGSLANKETTQEDDIQIITQYFEKMLEKMTKF